MTANQATSEATSYDGQWRPGEPRAVASRCEASSGAPNKPMVPTAPTSPVAYPLHPMGRQIGQPFGLC